jgi:hypothetical protein
VVALFKERTSANIIWLIVLCIAAHSHFLFFPPTIIAQGNDGLISVFLRMYFTGLHSGTIIAIYFVLILSQAFHLNFLFNHQRMFNRSNYLTAMTFILITAVFREWNHLMPALIANSVLIWLYSKIINLYNNPNPKSLLFNIGLIIGTCVLLYHPTALLIIVAIFALLVVRPFSITELLVMLMGVLSPFYFLGVYLFISDNFTHLSRYLPTFQLNLPDVKNLVLFFVSIGLIILFLFIGIYQYQSKNRRVLIHIRKNWGVLIAMLLVMLPLPFINENANLGSLLMWSIPVSPFIANGFLGPNKNTFPNIMFWLLIIMIVCNNWNFIRI